MDAFNIFAFSIDQVKDVKNDERAALLLNWLIHKILSNIEQDILSDKFGDRHHVYIKYSIVSRRFSWLSERQIRDTFAKLKKLGIIESKEVWTNFLDKNKDKKRIQAITLTPLYYEKYLKVTTMRQRNPSHQPDASAESVAPSAPKSAHRSYNRKVKIYKSNLLLGNFSHIKKLDSKLKKIEEEAYLELIKNHHEEEITRLVEDLLCSGTLKKENCICPLRYLSKCYDKVLDRVNGVGHRPDIDKVMTILRLGSLNPIPINLIVSHRKELLWIDQNGGRRSLGQKTEFDLKRML